MKKAMLPLLLVTVFFALGSYSNNRFSPYSIDVTASVNPGDLADGAGETIASISAPGARFGDYVAVAAPYDLQDLIVTAYVQAANVVEIRIQNENAAANVNLGNGIWKIRILK